MLCCAAGAPRQLLLTPVAPGLGASGGASPNRATPTLGSAPSHAGPLQRDAHSTCCLSFPVCSPSSVQGRGPHRFPPAASLHGNRTPRKSRELGIQPMFTLTLPFTHSCTLHSHMSLNSHTHSHTPCSHSHPFGMLAFSCTCTLTVLSAFLHTHRCKHRGSRAHSQGVKIENHEGDDPESAWPRCEHARVCRGRWVCGT